MPVHSNWEYSVAVTLMIMIQGEHAVHGRFQSVEMQHLKQGAKNKKSGCEACLPGSVLCFLSNICSDREVGCTSISVMDIHHSSHYPLMMEIEAVFKTPDSSFIFTQLIN